MKINWPQNQLIGENCRALFCCWWMINKSWQMVGRVISINHGWFQTHIKYHIRGQEKPTENSWFNILYQKIDPWCFFIKTCMWVDGRACPALLEPSFALNLVIGQTLISRIMFLEQNHISQLNLFSCSPLYLSLVSLSPSAPPSGWKKFQESSS